MLISANMCFINMEIELCKSIIFGEPFKFDKVWHLHGIYTIVVSCYYYTIYIFMGATYYTVELLKAYVRDHWPSVNCGSSPQVLIRAEKCQSFPAVCSVTVIK